MAQSEPGNVEKGVKKRKNEEEDPPPTAEKKNLSKFTLNCTFSLNTNTMAQEAFILTQVPRQKCKKLKSSTSKKEDDDSNSTDGESDDDKIREPTADELKEAEEPRNILSIITLRDKKRQSHMKNMETKAEKDAKKNMEKITEYLQKWKNNKSEWKFEKLRQIYLMDVMFEEDKISDELWPIALEYLSGTKGSAKEKIIQNAQDEIQEVDDEVESTGDNDLMNQVRYRRAREVLQTLG